MKNLLVLAFLGMFMWGGAKADDENIIDSPVYEGYKDSAVSNNGGVWSAKNAIFKNNSAGSTGGAIDNTLGYLYLYGNNSFENNSSFWGPGAIYNYGIAILSGKNVFEGNWSGSYGGAILSAWYTLIESDDETGKSIFRDNRAYEGGAIASMMGALYVNGAEFINNRAEDTRDGKELSEYHQGGAIYAAGDKHYLLNSEFRENHAYAGGAILTGFALGLGGPSTTFEGLKLYNTSFYDNKAWDKGGAIAAIAAEIVAAGKDGVSEFKGNRLDNGKNEAIYMTNEYISGAEDVTPVLILKTFNGGKIIMHDGIYGKDYDVYVIGGVSDDITNEIIDDEDIKEEIGDVLAGVTGEGGGEFYLLGSINDVLNFNVSAGATVHLGVNARIYAQNMLSGVVGRSMEGSPLITVDVEVNRAENKVNSGQIHISGDIVGNYAVLVNALNSEVLDNVDEAVVPFLIAENDNLDTLSSFSVARVTGSPYMWNSKVNVKNEQTGSTWYLNLTDTPNPDYEEEKPDEGDDKPTKPIYAPEVAAYVGLQRAALVQNRSVSDSVLKGLAYHKSLNCYQESCGIAELLPQRQAWIDVIHENAEIDTPSEMNAKINGTTFGFDLFREGTHRGGLFGAYRYGKYDLSGKGKYYAALESDITSKSYLGGAYYQYDDSRWRLTGTVFAGNQDMTINTEDGIAHASTNAAQYGASVETAKRYEISDNVNLEPSLGLYYTMLDIDNLQDNVGKNASFETLQYLEAEAGVKIEREICNEGKANRVYVKPSVIRTFSEGAKTKISGFSHSVKSYKDATLGRLEAGGEFDFGGSWNGYAHMGYTLGDGYKAYDLTFGMGYKF